MSSLASSVDINNNNGVLLDGVTHHMDIFLANNINDDDTVPRLYDDSLYTDFQNRFLSFAAPAFAIPSWIGSCLVVYVIVHDRRRLLPHTYHRLVLGVSVMDAVVSLTTTVFAGTWYIPRGAQEFVVGAQYDNDAGGLCSLQGVLTHAFFGTLLYSVCLAFFYALWLLGAWTPTQIAQRVEPWMHGIALTLTLALMVLPALLEWMNPWGRLPGLCAAWQVYPIDCHTEENNFLDCDRGRRATEGLWIFLAVLVGGGLSLIVFVGIALLIQWFRIAPPFRHSSLSGAQQQQQQQQQADHTGHADFEDDTWTQQHGGEEDELGGGGDQWVLGWTWGSPPVRLRRAQATVQRGLCYCLAAAVSIAAVVALALPDEPHQRQHRSLYFAVSIIYSVVGTNQGTWNALIYLRPRFRELTMEGGTLFFLRPLLQCLRSCGLCGGRRSASGAIPTTITSNAPGSDHLSPTPPSVSTDAVKKTNTPNKTRSLELTPTPETANHNNDKNKNKNTVMANTKVVVVTGGNENGQFELELDEQQLQQQRSMEEGTRHIPQTVSTRSNAGSTPSEIRHPPSQHNQGSVTAAAVAAQEEQEKQQSLKMPLFDASSIPVQEGYNRHVLVAPASMRLGLIFEDDEKVEREENVIPAYGAVLISEVFLDGPMAHAFVAGDRILSMDDIDVRHLTAEEMVDFISSYSMKTRRFLVERPQGKEPLDSDSDRD